MHIYIYNANDSVDELLAFVQDMMRASYFPAYGPEVGELFLQYHNAENIAKDATSGRIWCAREGDRLVGTVTVATDELTRMFVSPELQGRGVGRLLMDGALSWAKDSGVKKLTAWSVPFSRGFYEKFGFYMVNADMFNFVGTREPPVPYIEMALRPGRADEIRIEEASEADAEELLAGQKLAFREQCELYGDWEIPPMYETAEEFSEFLRSGGTVLKAVASGRIIGSVRGKGNNGICEAGRLFVLPGWQGMSAARKLISSLEERMADSRSFELFTGERSEKNLRLYEKQGYAPTGKRAPAKPRGGYDLVWLAKPNPWSAIHECARRRRSE